MNNVDGIIRTRIRIETMTDVRKLISICGSYPDNFMLETFDRMHRVSAQSTLGIMYMSAEHGDEIYLVNLTHNGEFPTAINDFAV